MRYFASSLQPRVIGLMGMFPDLLNQAETREVWFALRAQTLFWSGRGSGFDSQITPSFFSLFFARDVFILVLVDSPHHYLHFEPLSAHFRLKMVEWWPFFERRGRSTSPSPRGGDLFTITFPWGGEPSKYFQRYLESITVLGKWLRRVGGDWDGVGKIFHAQNENFHHHQNCGERLYLQRMLQYSS